MQCEEDWVVMHALHTGHGWSISQIAREFDVNWRTARRYATSEAPVRYGPRARPMELSEAQLAHVVRRLELCPKLRATTLLREVRDLGYQGSYASFARRIRALSPDRAELDPQVRFETDLGLQAQVDSGCRPRSTRAAGPGRLGLQAQVDSGCRPRSTGPTAAAGCSAKSCTSSTRWSWSSASAA
jgi:hypothetical protein